MQKSVKDKIYKEGYLNKQSLHLKQSRKRWMILTKTCLCSYKSNNDDIATEIFYLNNIKQVRSTDTKTIGQFEIIMKKRKHRTRRFIASTIIEMNDWINTIKIVMNNSKQQSMQNTSKTLVFDDESTITISHEYTDNIIQETYWLDNKIDTDTDDMSVNMSHCNATLPKTPSLGFMRYLHRLTSSNERESDNEFECDTSDYRDDSFIVNDNDDDDDDDDILEKLKKIKKSELMEILIKHDIIYDSLIRVYSIYKKIFIDFAAILTKERLYLISAHNYQIWEELRDRTKINELINIGNKNENILIDHKMAMLLVNNLDLVDDDDINEAKIMGYFMNKTAKEVKLNILLHKNRIHSLSQLFNLNEQSLSVKQIKHVCIHKLINRLDDNIRDDFLSYILNDIKWIDQNNRNNGSKIITLEKYCDNSIISILNKRKQKYFSDILHLSHYKSPSISVHRINKIKHIHDEIVMVYLNEFCIIPIHQNNEETLKGYKLTLKKQIIDDISEDEEYYNSVDEITMLFHTNNSRHEWMTYLDYAIDYNSWRMNIAENIKDSDDDDDEDQEITSKKTNKLMNEFDNFGFGVYLNYWEYGKIDSVIPKYCSLKEEIITNKIANISTKQWYELYIQCEKLMKVRGFKIKARNIGVNNKKFNIPVGAPITINHLISLKLYTDFGSIQRKFKQNCRKNNDNELLQDLIERNSEIALWCRYLKESCTFYGKLMRLMTKPKVVYAGLKAKYLFNSLSTIIFECPLSTTITASVAEGYRNDNGIILTLKAANSKTSYFDVSWLSHYQHEQERLFMGSSLKICDIYIQNQSHKKYINAIAIFEQIINGKFVDFTDEIEHTLYLLISFLLNKSTEKTIKVPPAPKYIMSLFENMVNQMIKKYETKNLWINEKELEHIKHKQLKCLLIGDSKLFNHFGINLLNVKKVQCFKWNIKDSDYIQFINMRPKCITSNRYEYRINDFDVIGFYLKCYAKYSNIKSSRCAIFLYLDELPMNIEAIKIEYDIYCDKRIKYRHSMQPQWLSKNKKYCGFQTFPSKSLKNNSFILWNIAIKIIDIKKTLYIPDINNIDYNDKEAVKNIIYSLHHKLEQSEIENMCLRDELEMEYKQRMSSIDHHNENIQRLSSHSPSISVSVSSQRIYMNHNKETNKILNHNKHRRSASRKIPINGNNKNNKYIILNKKKNCRSY